MKFLRTLRVSRGQRRRRGPKVFVFDADLAGVDRPELARMAGPPERRCTRMLALAEYLDDEMERELKKLGIDAALRKPFHREELAKKVSELLTGPTVQVPVSDYLPRIAQTLEKEHRPQMAKLLSSHNQEALHRLATR